MILWISQILIPFMVCYITGFGLLSGRPVFDDFLEGAKSGMKTAAGLLPVFVGLMTAVGVMRSSGLLEALGTNSAATGLLLDLFEKSGPDSPLGMCASVMMSCTETVFYCLSVYFGSVNVRKTRYAMAGALFATGVGVAVSIWLTLGFS